MKCNATVNVVYATFKPTKTVKVFCKLKSLHDEKRDEESGAGRDALSSLKWSLCIWVQGGTTGAFGGWFSSSSLGRCPVPTLLNGAGPSYNLSTTPCLLLSSYLPLFILIYSLGLLLSILPPHLHPTRLYSSGGYNRVHLFFF